MDSDKLFQSLLCDKRNVCRDDCLITHTKFLDLNQQSVFSSFERDEYTVRFIIGGYPEAERKIGVFVPKAYGINSEDELSSYDGANPLCVIRIDKDKFSVLSHRDYLGAIMNTGVAREMIGDIIADEKGAYVITFPEIAKYLRNQLFRIGRGTVKVSDAAFENITDIKAHTKESFVTVASLRLDNIVSAAFSVSRNKAVQEISAGKVFVNDILIEKNDFKVPVGAKIVLRGKGKAVLSEEKGKSRKDRPQIIIKRYI